MRAVRARHFCAQLGDADAAAPILRRLMSEVGQNNGWPLTPALLRLDSMWDLIRDNAAFQGLLKATDVPARGGGKASDAANAVN